jgi:hypothetical protein
MENIVEEHMKQDIQQEERRNAPLSTAALAHVDERTEEENRAENRATDRRLPDAATRDIDRPPTDGGPSLVPSGNQPGTAARNLRTTEPVREQNRLNAIASRQPAPNGKTSEDEQATPLFAERESKDLFAKWDALQVEFIDEPRRAVEQADNLVATAMKRTAEIFAEERARLERQWDRGDNVSTEDLRIAMRRYRSFFRRLLAV